MRARNREINIFNMSLLDILCGALGAFCFMMIVLLPYYKPGAPEDAKKQQDLEKTVKELDELKEKLKDAGLAKDLADLIEKLKAQIKELEGRVNSLVAENQKIRQEADVLTARNKQLEDERKQLDKWMGQLRMREPFLVSATVMGSWGGGEEQCKIDLYVFELGQVAREIAFDPAKEQNNPHWPGDCMYQLFGVPSLSHPYTNFLVRDVNPGATWKIYAKLELWTNDKTDSRITVVAKLSRPVAISAGMTSQSYFVILPQVTLTPEHPWTLVGFVNSDKGDNTKLTMRVATQAEREAEWKALDKKR